jgi:REP element-mobilizing transposase RayT
MGVSVRRGLHSEIQQEEHFRDPAIGTGDVFQALAPQKESEREAGHLLADHVHLLISIPPKYAVAQVVGSLKGKSAIQIARHHGEGRRNFVGQHFWARAGCEHPFRVMQVLWGSERVRFRGIAKKLARAQTLFALANRYAVRRRLLPPETECAL